MLLILNWRPGNERNIAILTVAAIAVFSILEYYQSFKEITWRDFNQNYLSKGNIDRLEVVNKKWVKVVLRTPEQVRINSFLSLFNSSVWLVLANLKKQPWFSIGSVDAFERNLDAAQAEAGIDSNSQVPVVYKSEMEL